HVKVARVCPPDNPKKALAATGHLSTFRCTFAEIGEDGDGVTLDPMAAAASDVREGDMIWHSPVKSVAINFAGIVGPSHNYAGSSLGNLASASHAGDVSY
ncbi:hypothetical protein OY671_010596, partial [Metschnikowia pulcherrima]